MEDDDVSDTGAAAIGNGGLKISIARVPMIIAGLAWRIKPKDLTVHFLTVLKITEITPSKVKSMYHTVPLHGSQGAGVQLRQHQLGQLQGRGRVLMLV